MHAMCRSPHPSEQTAEFAIDFTSLGAHMESSCAPCPRGPLQHGVPFQTCRQEPRFYRSGCTYLPHVNNVPWSDAAAEYSGPQATQVITVSLASSDCTRIGLNHALRSPWPRAPHLPSPQLNRVPVAVTIIVCSVPQAAATAKTSLQPTTTCGQSCEI